MIRAIGPSLANANPPVANPLMDPVLEIHNVDGDLITSNDNWMDDPNMQLVIDNNLAPTADAESAIYADLLAGNYTAVVTGNRWNDRCGAGRDLPCSVSAVRCADRSDELRL